MTIDLKTVMLISSLVNFVCAGAIATIWYQNRKRFAGLAFWLASMVLLATGTTLMVLRGLVPDFFSIVLANTMVVAGIVIIYMGLERFVGRKSSQIHNYVLLAIFVGVHAYYTHVQPILLVRSLNFSVATMIFTFQCCWLLLRRVDSSMRQITFTVGIVFGCYVVASFARIVLLTLFPYQSSDFFKTGMADTLAMIVYILLTAALALSLILMVNRSLLGEIQTYMDDLETKQGLLNETSALAKVGGWEFDVETLKPKWTEEVYHIHEVDLDYQPTLEKEISFYTPEAIPVISQAVRRAIEQGEPFDLELPFITAKGNHRWIHAIGRAYRKGRKIVKVGGVFQDITERKLMQDMVNLRLRLWEFSITHSTEELLQKTLDEVCSLTDSPIGFYHFMEADQKTLSLQAWSTRTTQEFCTAQGTGMHYSVDDAGVWVDCVHQRRPVIHNDYASLPHRKGMPQGHAHVTRELVVPIMRHDRIVAILGVGNKPSDYTEKDVEIVNYLADIAWEIAEHKKVEEALRTSEDKYRDLVENLNDVIYTLDTQGNITYMSPALERLSQYKISEIIDQSFSQFVHPDDLPGLITSFQGVLAGQLQPSEYRLIDKDGGIRWVSSSSRPRVEDGKVVGVTGILTDITEQKQAGEATKEAEERYRALFDRSLEAVYIHDLEGNFVDANEVALDLLGYTREDIPSLNFASLLDEEQMQLALQTLDELTKTGTQKALTEFKLRRKDGDYVYVETMASVIYKKGKPELIQGIARNITERKKMLQHLVLTDRLAALGNMAGGFAHELNNPLTAVMGYAQLLQERKDLPADIRKDIELIYKEGQRAANIIKNFMVFAGRQPAQKQLTDINSLIQDILNLRQREQAKNNIVVKTRFGKLPPVEIDQPQMRQVFLNIVINAEYFMSKAHQKGTLTITTRKSGKMVTASFTDDGPGIPSEQLSHVFDPFFTTKEVGQGTGLGLSICHGIVTEHGGKIHAESQEGRGTTFVVELPVAK